MGSILLTGGGRIGSHHIALKLKIPTGLAMIGSMVAVAHLQRVHQRWRFPQHE